MFGAGLELRAMSMSELMYVSERARRIEVFTGAGRRRNWPADEKAVSIRSGPPCRAWVRVRSIRVCWIDLDRAHVWTQSFRAYGGGQYAPVLGGLGEARHCRRGAADHEFDLFGGAPARDCPEPSVSVAARTS